MAWLIADKSGNYFLCEDKPTERTHNSWSLIQTNAHYSVVGYGSVNLITNRKLPKWEDEPVQIGVIYDLND